MGCAICKFGEQTVLFKDTLESAEWILNGIHYDYVRCDHCGFIQSSPIPKQEELNAYYQHEYAYDWFQKNMFFKRWQARHRLFKVRNHLKNKKRVLDFGCGHGFFVQALTQKGFHAFGFDIGSDKIMHHNNGKITNRYQLSDYEEKDFDVITMWHVLEHMRDQDAVLEDLKARLHPGGTLIIAVPNTDSLSFKLTQQKWGWLQQPYVHINQYNAANLCSLLERKGFTIRGIRTSDTWDQNLYDLLISLLFYRNKSRNTVRQYGDSGGGSLFFRINQMVRLCFTPISYFVSFLRRKRKEGNELLIIANK